MSGIHSDFKHRKSVTVGKVVVSYGERRDHARAQLKVNHIVVETGPTEKIRRRFNTLVTEHHRRQGQPVPSVYLLRAWVRR